MAYQNITVVLFMHYLSHGDKHQEFHKFAESTVTQPAVLAATVGAESKAEPVILPAAQFHFLELQRSFIQCMQVI